MNNTAAKAELNHVEYHSVLEGKAEYVMYAYITLTLIALTYAAYLNFFRKKA